MTINIDKSKAIIKLRINFDEDMKLSLNKVWSGGAGTQWVRKKAADLWHEDIENYLDSHRLKKIDYKVDFYFEFYFSTGYSGGQKTLDSSNCAAMGKMIEDSLCYHKTKNPKGIIADDTNQYVGKFCLHSMELPLATRKKLESNYVDVYIFKA